MGSLESTRSTRCRSAACFALGLLVASLLLAAMLWILWCYMGLGIVQVSDSQRRGLVNYSHTTSKPSSTTPSPVNRTEVDGALESSLNAISKSLVTPPTQPRRRGDASPDLAKGDFASRTPGSVTQNSTRRESIVPSVTSSSDERRASIVHAGEEEGLHPRKVSTSNRENRDSGVSQPEIKPTPTYAPAQSDPLPTATREERRPISSDSDRKDEVQSSRPSFRDPEFEREPPARRSDPGRRRYDDDDDYYDRGSPSRYDKRDRGRDTDDRYSKGDTRVYPDERPRLDDRYPPRDSDRRRGDDRDREDRYRDREDRPRDYDDRYRDRGDRPRDYDDRHRDREDRPRDYDDRHRDREDRPRDYDDRYRDRDRPYLDDDRNRKKDDQDEDRYSSRGDRYRPRDPDGDDRSRDRPFDVRKDRVIPRDDEDRYSVSRDRDYREPIMSSRTGSSDRKSGRPDDARRPSDYDSPIRDRPRTSYSDESRTVDRYPIRDDEYSRPSKYDDRDRIYPTRTREETHISRSTVPLSRSRDDAYELRSSVIDGRRRDDDRYSSNRDRSRYYGDDDRRVDESRYISPSSVRKTDSTRRDIKNTDDAGLERRSYSAEEEEEYRRQNSRTRYYDDRDRKSSEDTRRDYRTDDDYPKRTRPDDDDYPRRTRTGDDDEYHRNRPRGDYDRYDRPIDDDRPSIRQRYDDSRPMDTGPRKDSHSPDMSDDDRSLLLRREERLPAKDRRYSDDIPPRRPIYDDSDVDRPPRPAVDRGSEGGRRRYKDDLPPIPDEPPRRVPLRSEKRESFVGSPTLSRDVVERERPYHSSGRTLDVSGRDERPINAKDVIEAALKQSDAPNPSLREVSYPVFDPRVSNLTASDYIPLSDRKGITIMSRRRRRRQTLKFLSNQMIFH